MTYIGTSDLIWQNDIRVSAFPSGLLLVQRSAVCRKTDSKRDEISLNSELPCDNTGAIDGVFIFPDAQEKRDVSFTTYDVSGYGRSTDVFRETIQERPLLGRSATIGGEVVLAFARTKSCIQTGVIFATASAPVTAPSSPAEIYVNYNGTEYSIATYWETTGITRTNYGVFDEVVISWALHEPTLTA